MQVGVKTLVSDSPKLILSLLFVAPLIALAYVSLQFDVDIALHVFTNLFSEYFFGSLYILFVAIATALPIGIGCGYVISRYSFFGSSVLKVALLLPLAIPAYILGYSVIGFFDINNDQLSFIFVHPYISVGILFGLNLYPYLYLLASHAFSQQSRSLEEIALLHGHTRLSAFYKISLPLALPAVVVGCTLIGMEVLADFGLVKIFGLPTLTVGIFRVWSNFNAVGTASLIALFLVGLEIILLIIEKRQRSKMRYYDTGTKQPITTTRLTGIKNITAMSFCLLPLILGFILPVYQLLSWSSLHSNVFNISELLYLIKNSVLLSIISAVIIILSSVAILTLLKNRASLSYGYALPGLVIALAISFIASFLDTSIVLTKIRGSFDFLSTMLFSGSIVFLIYAYLIRYIAVPIHSLESSIATLKPSLVEQLRFSKQRHFDPWRYLYIPVLKQPICFTLIILFIEIIKELPATLILRPLDFNTLAVRVYELINDERFIEAAPYSLALIMCGLISVSILSVVNNRQ